MRIQISKFFIKTVILPLLLQIILLKFPQSKLKDSSKQFIYCNAIFILSQSWGVKYFCRSIHFILPNKKIEHSLSNSTFHVKKITSCRSNEPCIKIMDLDSNETITCQIFDFYIKCDVLVFKKIKAFYCACESLDWLLIVEK